MLTSRRVAVGTTPVDLLDGLDFDGEMVVHIRPLGGSLWIGGADLSSASDGYLVEQSSDSSFQMRLHDDHPFGVVQSGTTSTSVLVYSV